MPTSTKSHWVHMRSAAESFSLTICWVADRLYELVRLAFLHLLCLSPSFSLSRSLFCRYPIRFRQQTNFMRYAYTHTACTVFLFAVLGSTPDRILHLQNRLLLLHQFDVGEQKRNSGSNTNRKWNSFRFEHSFICLFCACNMMLTQKLLKYRSRSAFFRLIKLRTLPMES